MDLKFSFGAANPLPLANAGVGNGPGRLGGASSVLEMRVTLQDGEVTCEGLSGDGVSYARVQKSLSSNDTKSLAAAVRSVLARGGAELPEPLIESVTSITLALEGRETDTLSDLGLAVASGSSVLAQVDEALQARTGIVAGTPIQLAD